MTHLFRLKLLALAISSTLITACGDAETNIVEKDGIYRLRLGPIKDAAEAQAVLEKLKQNQFQNAFLLYSE